MDNFTENSQTLQVYDFEYLQNFKDEIYNNTVRFDLESNDNVVKFLLSTFNQAISILQNEYIEIIIAVAVTDSDYLHSRDVSYIILNYFDSSDMGLMARMIQLLQILLCDNQVNINEYINCLWALILLFQEQPSNIKLNVMMLFNGILSIGNNLVVLSKKHWVVYKLGDVCYNHVRYYGGTDEPNQMLFTCILKVIEKIATKYMLSSHISIILNMVTIYLKALNLDDYSMKLIRRFIKEGLPIQYLDDDFLFKLKCILLETKKDDISLRRF
jgi:hypothetical protein